MLVVIVDGSEPLTADDQRLLDETRAQRRVIVANKRDLGDAHCVAGALTVSATTGEGLDRLRCALVRELTGEEHPRESPAVTNVRHISLLEDAAESLGRVVDALGNGEVPEEFLLPDLHAARSRFDEVVGVRTSDDVLNHIFEKFCIGK